MTVAVRHGGRLQRPGQWQFGVVGGTGHWPVLSGNLPDKVVAGCRPASCRPQRAGRPFHPDSQVPAGWPRAASVKIEMDIVAAKLDASAALAATGSLPESLRTATK